MKRFKEFFSDKMITESPRIDPNLNKNRIRSNTNYIKQLIKDNHKSATKLGEDAYYQKSPSHHIYYRYKNGKVKECSLIDNKNTQVSSDKGQKGSVEHINRFVERHVKQFGFVGSDKVNTKGSKHFWKIISENTPKNMTLYHVYNNGDKIESNIATPEYIKSNEHKIWGTDNSHENHRIILHKNEKI